jgi:hypothetical protein
LTTNDSIHVFADHRSDSFTHNQVQTCTQLVPAVTAGYGSAAKRHRVFSDAYLHMHQGKYVAVGEHCVNCCAPVLSRIVVGASPGNQPATQICTQRRFAAGCRRLVGAAA